MGAIAFPGITQFGQIGATPIDPESHEMPSPTPSPATTSVASVSNLLRECLRQLDELGFSIPASHVDHALALLPKANEQQLAEMLRIADDLMLVKHRKRRLH